MDKMIAYCGLVCTDCEAYIATQANDLAALEQMAVKAREEFNMPDLTVESAMCDGCLSNSERLCGYCFECQVRACGVERGVVNCAHCDDYACEKLAGFFGFVPDARATLDGIRQGL
ncbi:MAG: DUF3795 domain-containing protein [Anaerolineae bacterium]|nr:DUF3795 domain-containing protein [Anaerolineae bacterium]